MTYWNESVHSLLRPVKHCCHVNPAVLPETTDPDWDFDYIDIGSVTLSEGVTHKERLRFEASPSRARKPVQEGDILVSTVRTYLKAIAIIEPADAPQVASTGFAVLRAGKNTDARFLHRAVQSNPFVEKVVSQSTGVSYPAINASTLSSIKIPLPDLPTQRAIADFLDHETARIDSLIEKKQQLMELLGEKRSAVITASVTGQDPAFSDASGSRDCRSVEGGGGVITLQERVHAAPPPRDWQLDKLHQVFRVRRGNKNDGMKEDNLLSLSHGRIIQKGIETAEGLLPENFEGYQIVEPGNIVLRLTDLQNDKRSLRQGLVTQRGIVTSAYDAVEVQRDNDPLFWFYSLLALDLAKHYYSLGGGVRQSVKFANFPNDWVYRPDLPTQRAIADFLDRETARIDSLVDKTKVSIDRLKEYRSALITSAVTGQIDVSTYAGSGNTDRQSDAIQLEIQA